MKTEYQFNLEVEVLELSSDLSPESSAGVQTSKTTEMKDPRDVQRTGLISGQVCSARALMT